MVQPIGMVLAVVLATSGARSVRRRGLEGELGVEGAAWHMTCAAIKETGLAMAALLPPGAADDPGRGWSSRSGAATSIPASRCRSATWRGAGFRRCRDWTGGSPSSPRASPARTGCASTSRRCRARILLLAQTVTAFFRNDGSLQHLWTGASDWHERRFDACALDTTAQFSLSRSGELVRDRRTKRTVGSSGAGVDGESMASTKAKCVAPPPDPRHLLRRCR